MKRYIYCADAAWDTSRSVRAAKLTPRCVFWAADRAEARTTFEAIERTRWPLGRDFGAAGFRQETAREHARIVCPCDTLPDINDYLGD